MRHIGRWIWCGNGWQRRVVVCRHGHRHRQRWIDGIRRRLRWLWRSFGGHWHGDGLSTVSGQRLIKRDCVARKRDGAQNDRNRLDQILREAPHFSLHLNFVPNVDDTMAGPSGRQIARYLQQVFVLLLRLLVNAARLFAHHPLALGSHET